MTDDVKALIAEARAIVERDFTHPRYSRGEAVQLHSILDALEAATVAPAPGNNAVLHQCPATREVNDVNGYCTSCQIVHRAFPEAATVAPAVDREALVELLGQDENYTHSPDGDGWVFSPEMAAIGLLTSGILRDVRDVQAEALEDAATEREWLTGATLRARAQAIREARND